MGHGDDGANDFLVIAVGLDAVDKGLVDFQVVYREPFQVFAGNPFKAFFTFARYCL
jgi:hypothetical protein